ncbi:hypothetical protein [Bacillus sp. FSL K6-3431]|uniref:hypothetical protein n=1 Tax=Bacillus sp. FSL K6-3431 TaxID=2921500 RepID=UPI0030FBBBB8
MKRLVVVIPIMVIVATIAMWMLEKDYSDIEPSIRLMITGGAAILSGIISYFLMRNDIDKVDPPKNKK